MYKLAAQRKLRFQSNKGPLTVEQLFELPLKSKTGCDLDTVARSVNNELKTIIGESFVDDSSSNPRKKELELALEIVKDVIKTQQDENASQALKLRNKEEKRKLLDIINMKKDAQLSEASLEELQKRLAAIPE